ncbi:carboxylase [Alteromonas aestuariivivens]|uniref:Carboxylase n=1 Tax=Alteromonas aestuariivivens TaxID=1938339 RepID=A0A3D8MBK1_9ALTE|nr:biotin-dependent carboxyltransferase family protein [Alteromonas aestuariivivens]RDV27396.1 carboxylase [Alteromonas aestuariivivens]
MSDNSAKQLLLNIADKGLLSMIVDGGRSGLQQQGFCQSGPMDEPAFHWANWLCDNESANPAIEFIGQVIVDLPATIAFAVTGPGAEVWFNGQLQPLWQTLSSLKGGTLRIQPHRIGTRHYLAFSADWALKSAMGSVSTVIREGLGGLAGDGKPLASGTQLKVCPKQCPDRSVPVQIQPEYALTRPLEVILGYQADWFSGATKNLFFSESFQLSSQVDRMGYRLQGTPVRCGRTDLRSEGINQGAIQVPSDGQPIIMMKDRQTLGGYPKIGCVALYDIPRLAQATPGDRVTFTSIDTNNARATWLLARQRRHLYRKGK